MKTKILFLAGIITIAATSCKNNEARYVNLNTGEDLTLVKDEQSGMMVDSLTGKPVEIYVDTKTRDTIYGRSGKVINGYVVKSDKGDYAYADWKIKQDEEEYKAKSEDVKIKSEGDESKVKDGDYTKKVDGDGDVKIETGTKQIKIDGKTGERKVKKDRNITNKVKKIFD